MRARRLLIPLMMLLLLLPQAQAERLTLYTRPGQWMKPRHSSCARRSCPFAA